MTRLLIVLAAIAIALMVFTIVDIALADDRRVRGIPKGLWYFVALLPLIGPLLWFAVGKGPAGGSGVTTPVAPDDDPAFLRNLRRDEEQDERIRRLEQELADLDDDPPAE